MAASSAVNCLHCPKQVLRVIKPSLFLVLMVCSLAACNQADKKPDNYLRINYSSGNLESTDPAFARNLYNMWTVKMIYNTLLEVGADMELKPSLAKYWEVSPDGLVYTFHLHTGLRFQDHPVFPGGSGRLMTAHDVVYSFARIVDPAVASSGAWIFNDHIHKEEPFAAINDSVFRIRLNKPFQPLPAILTMPYCSIVPREIVQYYGKDFGRNPCGTGPYMQTYWDEGNVLNLVRNPNYWEYDKAGKRLPYLDAIQISFIDSKATEFFLFLQGKLDFVNGIDGSFKDLVLLKNGNLKPEYEDKIRLIKRAYLNTEYIGFLTTDSNQVVPEAFKDVRVRQAINYAIDREQLIRYFRNGVGTPATRGFIPPAAMPEEVAAEPFGYGYSYRPDKAVALLKEAGYPGGKGLPVLVIYSPDNWSDIVNYIATQLQEIGVRVQVEIMQPNILRQQMSQSRLMAFRGQWIADYPDAETFLAFFLGKLPAPPNYTRFNNKAFDYLYQEAMKQDPETRMSLYRKMDSLVTTSAAVIPLFYDQMLHFTQPGLQNLQANALNMIDWKSAYFIQ